MSHRPRIRARRGPHPGPPPAQTLLERAREECRRKKTSFREVDAFVPKRIAFDFFFFFLLAGWCELAACRFHLGVAHLGRFSAVSLCHEKLENTRFHSARRAAMSGKERDQGVPSSSGRRERRPRGESTPSRPDARSTRSGRSGRSGTSRDFVRGGGAETGIQSLSSPLRTPAPVRVPLDKSWIRPPSASSVGSAKSAASRKFKRDDTLNGYLERLRDVEALCDLAVSRTKQSGHELPTPLAEFEKRKTEVLRCVNDMKDLPGSEQILNGKVSDEMFRELRYTAKRLDEYNQIPIDPLASLLSGLGLMSPTSQKEKIPQVTRLSQLNQTSESLLTIEEILTSQMSVLNWTLDDAVIPPAEQTITTPKGVKVSINDDGKSPFQEEATCCWCCSSAPIPEQKDQKEQKGRKK